MLTLQYLKTVILKFKKVFVWSYLKGTQNAKRLRIKEAPNAADFTKNRHKVHLKNTVVNAISYVMVVKQEGSFVSC